MGGRAGSKPRSATASGHGASPELLGATLRPRLAGHPGDVLEGAFAGFAPPRLRSYAAPSSSPSSHRLGEWAVTHPAEGTSAASASRASRSRLAASVSVRARDRMASGIVVISGLRFRSETQVGAHSRARRRRTGATPLLRFSGDGLTTATLRRGRGTCPSARRRARSPPAPGRRRPARGLACRWG